MFICIFDLLLELLTEVCTGTDGVINWSHSTKCVKNWETHPSVATEESDREGRSEEILQSNSPLFVYLFLCFGSPPLSLSLSLEELLE